MGDYMNKFQKIYKKIILDYQQQKINKQYSKEGLTDDVLKKQVEVNTLRNKYNISDDSKKIYKNFVQ